MTAEDGKGHCLWRDKLLDIARVTLAARARFGKRGEGMELGNLAEVTELGGGSEPVVAEVIPQAHMVLDIIKKRGREKL